MDFQRIFLRALAFLPAALHTAEAIFGSENGEQKKKAALEVVSAAINVGEAVSDKHVVDAERFTAGLGAIIDGVVECLNASVWARQ
jgi:hypothetical protein